jgi:hypothetical protein
MEQQRNREQRAGTSAEPSHTGGAAPSRVPGSSRERRAVTVETFGHEPVDLACEVERHDRASRIRRSLGTAGAMLGGAVLSLPIPGWHFVAVPAFLVAAVVLGLRRLRQEQSIGAISGACPACGTTLALRVSPATRFPHTVTCPHCRSFLKLRDLR